jgi:transcription elongation GreA/GreB family factor
VLGGVQDRGLREHGYRLLRELRPEGPVLYLDLLAQEGEPKALDVLVQGLREEAPRDLERFLDGLLAQPQKNPAAFYWLADRAAVDEELRARNPLRLLQHILQLPNRDEFAAWRARFPALVESGGTVPRLLAHLTPDQAPQAAEAIHRAPFLESYQREALSNALQLRFPAVLSDPQQDPGLYALPESIAAKRAEFEELVTRELPANRKAIEEARALGDLRENFEYKSARQRHEYLSARAAQLEGELANVQPIGVAPAEVEDVRIGTRVRLARGEDQRSLTILGPWESDPEAGVLSYQSDLAQALLGKKPGDTVTVEGDPWTVAAITPWR